MMLLVNTIASKKIILNGRFHPKLTNKDKQAAWKEVTGIINANYPYTLRTLGEVEMKWSSILSISKKKIGAIRKEYNQSGKIHFSMNVLHEPYNNCKP